MLTSRLIDRPIRPLFPSGWRNETQIIALVLSADDENDSDVLAITGASAALALSSIPFTRTIAGVRVGHVDGEFVINPTFEQRKRSRLDLIVAGSKDGIVMVEAGAKEVTEEEMVQALERAHAAIKEIVAGIDALAQQAGKKKIDRHEERDRQGVLSRGRGEGPASRSPTRCGSRTSSRTTGPSTRCSPNLIASIPEGEVERKVDAKAIFKELKEKVLRDEILERGKRLDGRAFDQIRHDHDRGRRPAARARLGGVHSRRDAGARHRDARHRRRPAEGRDGGRRDVEALHAPLQLPAVLGR